MVTKENNKDKENKFGFAAILVVGAVLLSLVIGLVGGRYFYNKLQIAEAELKLKKGTRVALEEKLENLKSLASKEEELKEKNKKVLAAIPDDKDLARLFRQFENIGNENGVSITKVSEQEINNSYVDPSLVQDATPSGLTPLSYEADSAALNYSAVKNSLSKFEVALRLLMIKDIEINTQDGMTVKYQIGTYKRSAQ